jgi:hypothetical protein
MGLLDAILRRKADRTVDWRTRQPTPEFTRIIDAKRYTTLDAKVVAQGPTSSLFVPTYAWLFQTNKNHFFIVYQSIIGQLTLIAIETIEEARRIYENLYWQEVPYQQVFPDVSVTDA